MHIYKICFFTLHYKLRHVSTAFAIIIIRVALNSIKDTTYIFVINNISENIFYTFNVQGSVHRKYIPFNIFPTRCNITQFIYFWKTALHVSGGTSTHHQEHIQVYLQHLVLVRRLLLPAAIVEELELV